MRTPRVGLYLLLALLASSTLWAQAKPSVRALKLDEPLTVDGRLTEDAWQQAEKGKGFRQYDPGRGTPATERTEFAVAYTEDHLYIGVWCYDSVPGGVLARTMNRDRVFTGSDFIYLFLDTFHDQRNGYVFAINPTGAQSDALITNNTERNFDWDGIWESKVQITDEGWFAEIAIPFKTVSFDPAGTTWGFNMSRRIRRKNESIRWTGWKDELRTHMAVEAGDITGLTGMKQGLGLEFSPYSSGRFLDTDAGEKFDWEVGADLRYRITPSFSATLSYNTDFAEAEVDQRVVNFTRFPLFFPEKRDFFLEDSGIYNFGRGSSSLLPYFTRRIGLSDGKQVPIRLATKLAGRLGKYDIGFTHALLDGAGGSGNTSVMAGRVSRRIFDQSSIGLIGTIGDPDADLENYVGGLDFKFRTNEFLGDKILALTLFGLGNHAEQAGGGESSDYAYGLSLQYPNNEWQWALAYQEIGEDFDPALGFVRRTGTRMPSASVAWQHRPGGTSWYREFSIGAEAEFFYQTTGGLDSGQIAFIPFDLEFESADELTLRVTRDFDRPLQDFEIGGVTIPAGEYVWNKARLAYETTSRRPVWVEVALQAGEFYDGTRTVIGTDTEWNANEHFRFNVEYQYNMIDLRGGSFDAHVAALRLNWNVTPELGWSAVTQYDSLSNSIGVNSRLRWEYRPGSTLYLVLNQALLAKDGSPELQSTDLTLKVDATIRF